MRNQTVARYTGWKRVGVVLATVSGLMFGSAPQRSMAAQILQPVQAPFNNNAVAVVPPSSYFGESLDLPGPNVNGQVFCVGSYENNPATVGSLPTNTYMYGIVNGGDRVTLQADLDWAYRIQFKCIGSMPDDSTAVGGLYLGFEAVNTAPNFVGDRIGTIIPNDVSSQVFGTITGLGCSIYDGEFFEDVTMTSERTFAWSGSATCGNPATAYACSTQDGDGFTHNLYGTHALPVVIDGPCFVNADLTTMPAVSDSYDFETGGVFGYVNGRYDGGYPGVHFWSPSRAAWVISDIEWIDWAYIPGGNLTQIGWPPVITPVVPSAWGIVTDPGAIDLGAGVCAVTTVYLDGGAGYAPGLVPELAPETFLTAGTHTVRAVGNTDGSATISGVRLADNGFDITEQFGASLLTEGAFDETFNITIPVDGLYITGVIVDTSASDCWAFATGIGERSGFDYGFDPGASIGPAVAACYSAVNPAWLSFGWVLDLVGSTACVVETLVVPSVPLDYWTLELRASADGRVPLSWVAEIVAAGGQLGSFDGSGCPSINFDPLGSDPAGDVVLATCQGTTEAGVAKAADISRKVLRLAMYAAVAAYVWQASPWQRGYREPGVIG